MPERAPQQVQKNKKKSSSLCTDRCSPEYGAKARTPLYGSTPVSTCFIVFGKYGSSRCDGTTGGIWPWHATIGVTHGGPRHTRCPLGDLRFDAPAVMSVTGACRSV